MTPGSALLKFKMPSWQLSAREISVSWDGLFGLIFLAVLFPCVCVPGYQQQFLPTALFLILRFISSTFSTLASFYLSGMHCEVLPALIFPEMCNSNGVVGSSKCSPKLWNFDSHRSVTADHRMSRFAGRHIAHARFPQPWLGYNNKHFALENSLTNLVIAFFMENRIPSLAVVF